jgi:hypothetical protein
MIKNTVRFTIIALSVVLIGKGSTSCAQATDPCPDCNQGCASMDSGPFGPSVSTGTTSTDTGQMQLQINPCYGTYPNGSHWTGTEIDTCEVYSNVTNYSCFFTHTCVADTTPPCLCTGGSWTCYYYYTTSLPNTLKVTKKGTCEPNVNG